MTSNISTGVSPRSIKQRRDIILVVHYNTTVTEITFTNVATYDHLRYHIISNPVLARVMPQRGDIILFDKPLTKIVSYYDTARYPLQMLSLVTLHDGDHIYVEVSDPPQPVIGKVRIFWNDEDNDGKSSRVAAVFEENVTDQKIKEVLKLTRLAIKCRNDQNNVYMISPYRAGDYTIMMHEKEK
ncbi:hypothetical protein DFA_04327 [Cavenderia fasciculata]|uniref:Uncharacterized protein n=1 Tax=Cavenderia fasciculata TaxID=261658 RepID=F4PP96_CACFS|nr:uncharacterized protein DFA_04327 [Cavenderia fasciculata]EGG22209.1 hypothetical protein DFA_04327 [Cavenderia fasciculata]|eukprot:XP_004360060.1 hypothetical protein DFA_04327 [Cavenderia fasciculata]